MNASRFVFALFLGLLLLAPSVRTPASANADTLLDDFDDGVVDTSRWLAMPASTTYSVGLGPGGTIAESGGRMIVHANQSGAAPFDTGFVQANALCYVAGDFDVQVDFDMVTPPDTAHSVGLVLQSGSPLTFATLMRAGPSAGSYQRFVYPSSFSSVGTSDTSGKLRFTRTATQLQAYYWNGSSWVADGPSVSWSTAPSGFALRIATNAPGASAADVAFDNLLVSGGTITCPETPGTHNVASTGPQSSYEPGAHTDQIGSGQTSIPTEATEDGFTLWPAGYDIDANAIPVGAIVGLITSNVGDFLCTGTPIAVPPSQLQKRPSLGSELLRLRTTVLTYAADYLVTADPETGGYRVTTELSTAAEGAPLDSAVPSCPPYSSSFIISGIVDGTPLLTNPSQPGLYPFLSFSRGVQSGIEYVDQSCVAIGGTVGVEFTDVDGDCLLDSPAVLLPAVAGGRLASPLMTPLDPNPADPDVDGDGLPDGSEATLLGSSPTSDDTDGDGLADLGEAERGSDPNQTNSDGDSAPDVSDDCPGVTDPLQTDTDGDGRGDVCDSDDDNDGMLDTWEALYPTCLDPLVNDASGDTDSDGLIAFLEFGQESSPCAADTDGDALGDYTETFGNAHTSPIKADTDGDGMPDGYEVARSCLNATVSDGAADPDADTRSNLTEYTTATNPCVADSPPAVGGIAEVPTLATEPSSSPPAWSFTTYAVSTALALVAAVALGLSVGLRRLRRRD
jgi:hypothetical protein